MDHMQSPLFIYPHMIPMRFIQNLWIGPYESHLQSTLHPQRPVQHTEAGWELHSDLSPVV